MQLCNYANLPAYARINIPTVQLIQLKVFLNLATPHPPSHLSAQAQSSTLRKGAKFNRLALNAFDD